MIKTVYAGSVAGMLTLTALASASSIPVGQEFFNPDNNHYYQVIAGDYFQSQQAAADLGGYLVSINDAAEQQWLTDTLPMDVPYTFPWPGGADSVIQYWIGINWTSCSPDFSCVVNWADGTIFDPNDPSQFSFWSVYQPSGFHGVGGQIYAEPWIGMNFRNCDHDPSLPECNQALPPNDLVATGLWNDWRRPTDLPFGIAEYTVSVFPIPGTAVLALAGLVGIFIFQKNANRNRGRAQQTSRQET